MTPTPDELMTCWNLNRGLMQKCITLDAGGRRKSAADRLAQLPDLQRWLKAIIRAAQSDFCTGRVEQEKGEPFIADFGWLVKPDTLILIEEGKFDSRTVHPLADAERSPKDLGYWNQAKDMTKLSPEEIRRLRICGLAARKWEHERKEKYGLKYDKAGKQSGPDPVEALIDWAFGKTQHVPPLVVNYGPPMGSTIQELEDLMRWKPRVTVEAEPKPWNEEETGWPKPTQEGIAVVMSKLTPDQLRERRRMLDEQLAKMRKDEEPEVPF